MIRRLATAGVTVTLLLVPFAAPAAQAASTCPSGSRAAADSLTITQSVNTVSVRLHWAGRWCVNTAGTALTRPQTHFDGSYTGTDARGATLNGAVVRTNSRAVHRKHGIVLNVSRLAIELPASNGVATGTTVDLPGTVKIGLSPKGWFVTEKGVRLPDTYTAS